ncbi:hypothetical protein NpPPO83_00005996 [Neofusicoccum parvum]|uniref:Uncharacterized protein n=2 Tax=Neofusicoccum TaxID=407951 RepID=A0ABR3S9D5_9PEZI|nr:hypothetical protein NpPPO83_00005996 [Neofusicoccum parvum]
MHHSYLILTFVTSLAAASPIASFVDKTVDVQTSTPSFPVPGNETDVAKRDEELGFNFSKLPVFDDDDEETSTDVVKRDEELGFNFSKLPVFDDDDDDDDDNDDESTDGQKKRRGVEHKVTCGERKGLWTSTATFKSYVTTFCNGMNGKRVAYYKIDGNDEKAAWLQYKLNGNVGVTYPDKKKNLEYEFVGGILNTKFKEGYLVDADVCNKMLSMLTDSQYGHYCHGNINDDTKGGAVTVVDIGKFYGYVKPKPQ